jgi:hypothetical protein
MEEENEVLDWGNEEDEHDQYNSQLPEDADDAVSLGDEEDEQAFYAQQFPENANGGPALTRGSDCEHVDCPDYLKMNVNQFFSTTAARFSKQLSDSSNYTESKRVSQAFTTFPTAQAYSCSPSQTSCIDYAIHTSFSPVHCRSHRHVSSDTGPQKKYDH